MMLYAVNEEDTLPQPQPESHTPPGANEESWAVDGGVDVEELRAGEQENTEGVQCKGEHFILMIAIF